VEEARNKKGKVVYEFDEVLNEKSREREKEEGLAMEMKKEEDGLPKPETVSVN